MTKPRAIFRGVLAAILCCSACSKKPAETSQEKPAAPAMQRLAVPDYGAYTGAYMGFGDREDDVSFDKIDGFETLVGKHQAIVASSSYWGEQSFPTRNMETISRYGAVPLVYWSPWDRPYVESRGPDRMSLDDILLGKWDAYIDKWADSAKAFGKPILVSFCNEMNGSWFPWSGIFYGAGRQVSTPAGMRFAGPEKFKTTWRYVVDRVRARGTANVEWVFHVMNFSDPKNETWNLAAQYYPGTSYVDWIGMSLYGNQFHDDPGWSWFQGLFEWPYQELGAIDPTKPLMLSEWGVGEFPKVGSKSGWFHDGFLWMSGGKFPRIKAAVYWNERWQNIDQTYSNLRVNSSPDSLEAYRQGIAGPYWLGYPIYKQAR